MNTVGVHRSVIDQYSVVSQYAHLLSGRGGINQKFVPQVLAFTPRKLPRRARWRANSPLLRDRVTGNFAKVRTLVNP